MVMINIIMKLHTPTNSGNNETIENYEGKINKEEAEKETDNENLNMKANDKEIE